MPIPKRTWKLIGSFLLRFFILGAIILGFYIFPSKMLHDIEPYTGTMAAAMRTFFYFPILVPAAVLSVTLGYYFHSGRKLQDTIEILAVSMILVCILPPLLYEGMEQDFLGNHIVYQGKCSVLNFDVTKGARPNLFANFTCENDPGYIFKVWDAKVLANAANHPNTKTMVYQLSAEDTLLLMPKNH